MGILLGRRQFLRALGAAAVVAATPWTWIERGWAAGRGRFFTDHERRTVDALAESILPADADPGASTLGMVRYIEGLLTAFDHRVPRLYAGGPFSGRQPFIDYARGVPSRRRPKNAFRRFVPPTRLQALYWRWQIYGTDRVFTAPCDALFGDPPTSRHVKGTLRMGSDHATSSPGPTAASTTSTTSTAATAACFRRVGGGIRLSPSSPWRSASHTAWPARRASRLDPCRRAA